jgi:serine/threonine-protein kinase HipA
MTTTAEVRLWGTTIGAVTSLDDGPYASFEYEQSFRQSGIQVSPLMMPLSSEVFRFPELPLQSFHGLPGLLSDSLPDKFGNALIDVWLASQGRTPESFNAVERLCYTGSRGMGALEFRPVLSGSPDYNEQLHVDALAALASKVIQNRGTLRTSLSPEDESKEAKVLAQIIQVGTSAGGARAKAVIAWNPQTNEIRSGQIQTDKNFEYWLIKFDGVTGNGDKELADPSGYGQIEYAYHRMAQCAGIEMSECRLLEENGRHHFMTKRFDRTSGGGKIHMQTLGALAHYDFNQAGAHSYEQVFGIMNRLGSDSRARSQFFRRMAFNILAANNDDHVKNISFLMDRTGRWSLAPAYDVTFSWNPGGLWTGMHQMSMNGKRERFTAADFFECGKAAFLKRAQVRDILAEVQEAVSQWPSFAEQAHVSTEQIQAVSRALSIAARYDTNTVL